LLQVFLMGRGYGVSQDAARDAASRVEGSGCNLEVIQKELESIALVNEAQVHTAHGRHPGAGVESEGGSSNPKRIRILMAGPTSPAFAFIA